MEADSEASLLLFCDVKILLYRLKKIQLSKESWTWSGLWGNRALMLLGCLSRLREPGSRAWPDGGIAKQLLLPKARAA